MRSAFLPYNIVSTCNTGNVLMMKETDNIRKINYECLVQLVVAIVKKIDELTIYVIQFYMLLDLF